MTMKTTAMPTKRTPNGVVYERPIALRLMPSELEQVKQLAKLEERSMASVCRRLVLSALSKTAIEPSP